jgi:hypothetical protein
VDLVAQPPSEPEERDERGEADTKSPPPKRRRQEVVFGSDEGIVKRTLSENDCLCGKIL